MARVAGVSGIIFLILGVSAAFAGENVNRQPLHLSNPIPTVGHKQLGDYGFIFSTVLAGYRWKNKTALYSYVSVVGLSRIYYRQGYFYNFLPRTISDYSGGEFVLKLREKISSFLGIRKNKSNLIFKSGYLRYNYHF